jgi:tetratricopeptide (TPR) repeat protein
MLIETVLEGAENAAFLEINEEKTEQKQIEKLIINSLQELKNLTSESNSANKIQKSKLIFPKKRLPNSKRISEQEARFLFVRELEVNEINQFYYSIETPTENIYQFSKAGKKIEPEINVGQSARIDVTLYKKVEEKFYRKHLIEFKQGNVDTCKKDFLKLLFDMDGLYNFYVNIIDRDDFLKRKTLESIIGKYQNAIDYLVKVKGENNSIVKIILFNINDGDTRIFEDINLKLGKTTIVEKSM